MTDNTDTDTEVPDWIERFRAAKSKPRPPAYCWTCGVRLTPERAGKNLRCPRCWDELLAAQPALRAGAAPADGHDLCTGCRGSLDGCAARQRGGFGRCCIRCTHPAVQNPHRNRMEPTQ